MKHWFNIALAALALSSATVQAATEVKVGMSAVISPSPS